MRCVENSPSHRLALSHGWTWWARTEFEGPAAVQRAVLLARPLRGRQARRARDLSPFPGRPGLDTCREGVPACRDGPGRVVPGRRSLSRSRRACPVIPS
jgi:hypothetical protein